MKTFYTSERELWREWLSEHFQTESEIWFVFPMKESGDKALSYNDAVEEALCFGWIDSTLKRLPDGRLAQRLSPRRKRSHWTELNKQRCADLEARGLMTDAGRRILAMALKN